MKLQSIQAIIFDAHFLTKRSGSPSREEALQGHLQPFFRESLERLSVLGYTFFWLDEDRDVAESFLRSQHVLHFFKKIYALPEAKVREGDYLSFLLGDGSYLPHQVLYLSFQLHRFYILAKKAGLSCFLFQQEEGLPRLRACLPKLYALVPWLIKSKGLVPFHWNTQRRSILQDCLGLPDMNPFALPKTTKALSDLVDTVFQKIYPANASLEGSILRAWEAIVGSKLASQSRPGCLVRGKQLIILAYNALVKQELHFQARPILKKLQALPGGEQLSAIRIQQSV